MQVFCINNHKNNFLFIVMNLISYKSILFFNNIYKLVFYLHKKHLKNTK